MKALVIAALLLSAPLAQGQSDGCVTDIRGNQVCGARAGQCALDRYRNAWCAPDNGTIARDRYDEVVCGAGACVRDGRTGELFCSAQSGGATSQGPSGLACEGGCVPASQAACRRMTPG